MVNARDQAGAIALKSLNKCEVPQWPLPVEVCAQDAGGKRLEIVFGARAQANLADVVADVWLGPGRLSGAFRTSKARF